MLSHAHICLHRCHISTRSLEFVVAQLLWHNCSKKAGLRRLTPAQKKQVELKADDTRCRQRGLTCVVGSPMLCAATVPMASPGLASAALKRSSISPTSQSNAWRLSLWGSRQKKQAETFLEGNWSQKRQQKSTHLPVERLAAEPEVHVKQKSVTEATPARQLLKTRVACAVRR
jgi:hypothetical protein